MNVIAYMLINVYNIYIVLHTIHELMVYVYMHISEFYVCIMILIKLIFKM